MGQYYRAMVIGEKDDIKVVSPYDFDNGAKLTGFSWCGNNFINAVLSLIHNNKAKVAFIGDYANEPYEPSEDYYASIMPEESFAKYYKAAWDSNEKLNLRKYRFTKDDMNMMDMDTTGKYLVNHDICEYIDIAAYIKEAAFFWHDDYWAVNPFPILTACGNGRGGGDFYSENIGGEYVGTWAFAMIEYTGQIPEGYTQSDIIFKNEEAKSE